MTHELIPTGLPWSNPPTVEPGNEPVVEVFPAPDSQSLAV